MVPGTPVGLTILGLMLLALGCTQSSGPVQQVTIDAAKVKSVVLKSVIHKDGSGRRFVVRDTDVIRRCVDELNRLAYKPYRPPMSLKVDEEFVLEDDAGNKIAGFGFTQDYCVRVFLPTSKPFYVRWGPLRTIGRLYSYGIYVTSREGLILLAKRETWDKETIISIGFDIRGIHSARPDLYLAEPSSPEELRSQVKALPEAKPDMLDEFPDYFR